MTIYSSIHALVAQAVQQAVAEGVLTLNAETPHFVVEPPRDPAHGDLATNVAMMLTKAAGKPPRAIAEILKKHLESAPVVAAVEIAGPGFINLRLRETEWQNEIRTILHDGRHYGDSKLGQGTKVLVEYVSANPTGPMHAGHVRGAVVGDALAGLLAKAGYDVTREYYFNDAGTQVDVLARTTYLRYREALGEDIGAIPEGFYPGEYLKDVGQALVARDGMKWQGKPEAEWLDPVREFGVQYMMRMIREDLDLIGIHHDVFTNEREMIENGTLEKSFKILEDKGLIYVGTLPPPKGKVMEDWEPAPLTLFRSSNFGDSTDRPLKKRDGNWAYIMPDIAYHYDKIRRGYSLLINVLGTDHGGYLERMRPVVSAFSDSKARLEVIFNSIVKVFKNGEPVKLSKRSGNLITLREMVEQVGAGAVRFFMLTRDPKSQLDFDFTKVVEQTRDNPVFYVQYAHARCCSILRHAGEIFGADELTAEKLQKADLTPISSPEELLLVKGMANWSRVVEAAATACEPHRVAFYLLDLAALFHGLWNKGNDNTSLRFIVADNKPLTYARMALIKAVQTVLQSGLAVMGCAPLEELRNDRPTDV
ncbi:MAG: arginine--tRNA ligase [Alphaproteobacteria bacterium]|nr:arginine--tRNA ligase [Alphaproteobacteria bacterium]